MCCLSVLLVAWPFTAMLSAVKETATLVGTLEETGPVLDGFCAVRCDVGLAALQLVPAIAA